MFTEPQNLIEQIEYHKQICKQEIVASINKFKKETGLTIATIGTTRKEIGGGKIVLISVNLDIHE